MSCVQGNRASLFSLFCVKCSTATPSDFCKSLQTDGITNTLNRNTTTFMQLRAKFALEISPLFSSHAQSTPTTAMVIQDASIRTFYDLVAESMGYSYRDFATRALLTPIPSTNGVAVLWLPGIADNPAIEQVVQNMARIQRRESPYSISLANCQSSARYIPLVSAH